MSKFVCFVLLVVCVVKYEAALTEQQRAMIHTTLISTGIDCVKDHPINFEHVMAIRNRQVPDDEVAKCFVKCFFQNLGFIEDDGKLSEEKAKESSRKFFKEGDEMLSKVDELVAKCLKVNDKEAKDGEKGCDRASHLFHCFVKHAPKLGFNVDF